MDTLTRSLRGSSNKQDALHSSSEMAVQVRPPRSNGPLSTVKALQVRPVVLSLIRPMMEENHYLHSMPAAPRYCFGVYLGTALKGGAVFTAGARLGHHVLAARPSDVVTLARLWLADDLQVNSESRVLGILVRWLRRNTAHKAVLSYADPEAGHTGGIYQAVGWLYLGLTEGDAMLDTGDGQLLHRRSAYDRFGSNSVGMLQRTGLPHARWVHRPGKHRYLCLLDPSWRWRLRTTPEQYPCRPP